MGATTIDTAGGEREAEEHLRRAGERIEMLLEELHATAGPTTWERIEELMQRLLGLYGAGLSRMLQHAREAGAPEGTLAARMSADDLLSSLLLVHGLHPASVAERVQRALEQVRPYLGSHAGGVELVRVDEDGGVRLRLMGSCDGCPSSRATVEHTLRRAVEEAAPEVTRIDVEEASANDKGQTVRLVQIDVRKQREPSNARWTHLDDFEPVAPGQYRAIDVHGTRMLVVNVRGSLLAYRSRCNGCQSELEGSRVEGDVLVCGRCQRRYDVAHGGRAEQADGPHLEPVPFLTDAPGPRVALPEVPS
jgi:Fe-S cluster biogenesis protein NfuA/nitrite reductase/ring-hydroxylating ferredoxin subunit